MAVRVVVPTHNSMSRKRGSQNAVSWWNCNMTTVWTRAQADMPSREGYAKSCAKLDPGFPQMRRTDLIQLLVLLSNHVIRCSKLNNQPHICIFTSADKYNLGMQRRVLSLMPLRFDFSVGIYCNGLCCTKIVTFTIDHLFLPLAGSP
jgi:hypothetical protein